jgi:CheY-like chemotaxis protein
MIESPIVLIVEDDASSSLLLGEILKRISDKYSAARNKPIESRILYAYNGIQAVRIAKARKIDIIFMDIRMNNVNGIEATGEIRKFDKNVIIIAQSALVENVDKQAAISAGCNDFMEKPYDIDLIDKLIQKYCTHVIF